MHIQLSHHGRQQQFWTKWYKLNLQFYQNTSLKVSISLKPNKFLLKAPYTSKIDILLSKEGLINWYIVLIQP